MARYQDRWIVVYHLSWRQGSEFRQLHITEASLDSNGRLLPIFPANAPALGELTRRLVTYAAHTKRFAQEYSAAQGSLQVQGPLKAHHIVLFPGGHLHFDDMDFGANLNSNELTLECITDQGFTPYGRLEIRIDHPKGPILAWW